MNDTPWYTRFRPIFWGGCALFLLLAGIAGFHALFSKPLLCIDDVSIRLRGEDSLRVKFGLSVTSQSGGKPVSGVMHFTGIAHNGTTYTLTPKNLASTSFSIVRFKCVVQDFPMPGQAPEAVIITLKEYDGDGVLLREQFPLQPDGQ